MSYKHFEIVSNYSKAQKNFEKVKQAIDRLVS